MRKIAAAFLVLPLCAFAYACSGDDDNGSSSSGGSPDASIDSTVNPGVDSGGDAPFNFDGSSGGNDGGGGDGGDGGNRDGGDAGFPFPLTDAAVTVLAAPANPADFYFLDGVTVFQNQVVFSDPFGTGSRYSVTFDGGSLTQQNVAGFNVPLGSAVGNDGGALYTAFQTERAIVKGAASFSTGPVATFNQPNDLIVASNGNVYVSDPFDYNQQNGNGAIYRIPAAGGAAVLVKDLAQTNPNGIALSPDEKTLYVSITNPVGAPNTGTVKKYPVNGDGSLGAEAAFASALNTPDGLAIDDAGNVYVALAGAVATQGKVFVYSAAGIKLGEITLPKGPAVSMAFGGSDRKTLFIAAGTQDVSLANSPVIYQVRIAVAGKP